MLHFNIARQSSEQQHYFFFGNFEGLELFLNALVNYLGEIWKELKCFLRKLTSLSLQINTK